MPLLIRARKCFCNNSAPRTCKSCCQARQALAQGHSWCGSVLGVLIGSIAKSGMLPKVEFVRKQSFPN